MIEGEDEQVKGREWRAVTWESPRNTADEPKACELEGGFVKVSSIQTYRVTLGLGPVESPLQASSSSSLQNGDMRNLSHRILEKMEQDNLHKDSGIWSVLSETGPLLLLWWLHGYPRLVAGPLTTCGLVEGCSWEGHSGSMNVC